MIDNNNSNTLRVVFDFQDDVDLWELSDRLNCLRKTLAEMDKSLSPDRSVSYKILKISKNSPIEIEAEPVVKKDGGVAASAGISKLVNGIKHIRKEKSAPPGYSLAMLTSIENFTKGLGDTKSIHLYNGKHVNLDKSFSSDLSDAIGPDTHSYGSFRGKLESMNVHSKNLSCYLYPRVGPERIKCVFKESLRESFAGAFDHYVNVYGKMKYKCMEEFPHEIVATEPPITLDSGSADLFRQLKGAAPNCTGNLDASDFVRGLRNGD